MVAPWLAGSLGTALDYTAVAARDRGDPLLARLLSLPRWGYYPLWIVNTGFGFPLALFVAAALVAVLARPGLWPGRPASAWMLASTVSVSWLVLQLGYTGDRAKYVFLWVPLGVLLAVSWIRSLQGRGARRAVGALVAASSLWTLGVSQRTVHDDVPALQWRGLYLVGCTGQYRNFTARIMKVTARPGGEPWPVREFAELVLADAGGRTPVVITSHPYVTANMVYEARIRRRSIEKSSPAGVLHLLGGPGRGARTDGAEGGTTVALAILLQLERGAGGVRGLARADYFVTDTLLVGLPSLSAALASVGISTEVLATREVTEHSTVRLVALRKPWDRPLFVPESEVAPLEDAAVAFANGWRLRAFELVVVEALQRTPVVHVYLAPPDGNAEACNVQLDVRSANGRPPVRAIATAPVPPRGEAGLCVVSFDGLALEHAPGLHYEVGLYRLAEPAIPVAARQAASPPVPRVTLRTE